MMKNKKIDILKKQITTLVALLASVASVLVFSKYLVGINEAFSNITFGLVASLTGGVLAYLLIRLQKLVKSEKTIFVSYTHQDSDFVDKLLSDLSSLNINFLIDRIELNVGDDIKNGVDNMIDKSDAIIFVISSNFSNSDWAQKELEQALNRDKKILPVVTNKESIPDSLSGLFYADFSEDYQKGIEQLERSLAK